MPINSTSTTEEVQAAYDDNAGYEESGSVAMARSFATACRILLRRYPKRSVGIDGSEVEIEPRIVQAEMESARRFIAANTSGRVRYASFEDFRD